MKKLQILLIAAALSFEQGALAQSAKWLTDYDKALEQAKTESKPVLIDFTGSDWCGWCMKMDEEVLDTKEFKKYAAENLVLVEADFPRRKHQTNKVKEQNEKLKERFSVQGFPTFVLVDKEGNELGRQGGYLEGGPQAFIAKLESLKK
jgi:thioredoxin-related protein